MVSCAVMIVEAGNDKWCLVSRTSLIIANIFLISMVYSCGSSGYGIVVGCVKRRRR